MPESLAGCRKWKWMYQGTGQGKRNWVQFCQGWVCDLGSVAKLCVHSLLPLTHRGMVFCVEKRCSGSGAALISAKTGPRWASKQVMGQAQRTGKKGTGLWLCVCVNLGVPFPLWNSLCLLGIKGARQDTLKALLTLTVYLAKFQVSIFCCCIILRKLKFRIKLGYENK